MQRIPPIWLIIFIAGLPQLCESVYSPSLPDIAKELLTTDALAEHTLTIYLMGFALGVFFFGKISDHFGRKPSMIMGLGVFALGCTGCYFSKNIVMLMMWRFVQAFGGSVGSVLSQSITRDSFHGKDLGRVYSLVGAVMAVFPAIGPFVGGTIATLWHWRIIFILLTACVVALIFAVFLYLPETYHPKSIKQRIPLKAVCLKLVRDKDVLAYGAIVAGCNGIYYSFFQEGSFYFIDMLHFSKQEYGACFLLIAGSILVAGLISRAMHKHYTSQKIMNIGIYGLLLSTSVFAVFSVLHHNYLFSLQTVCIVSLVCQILIGMWDGVIGSNALACALVNYKDCIGTASSVFGLYYYALTSFIALGMGILHNGTLLVMPLYFLGVALVVYITKQRFLKPALS